MLRGKLYRMFVDGGTDALLIDAWQDHNKPAGKWESVTERIDRRVRGFIYGCLLFALAAACIIVWVLAPIKQDPLVWVGSLVFALGGIGFYIAFYPDFDSSFLKDMKELNARIMNCGRMSLSELETRASERLVSVAEEIIKAQDEARGSIEVSGSSWDALTGYANTIKEGTFKPEHNIFFKFRLVDETWTRYFAEASQNLAKRR